MLNVPFHRGSTRDLALVVGAGEETKVSPASRRVDARTMALGINAGRVGLGLVLLGAPVGSVRYLGPDSATLNRVDWLIRTAAVRDAAIGAGTLAALVRGRGERAAPWVLAGAVCDAMDAVVTARAARQRRVDPIRGWLVAAGAAATAAVGVYSAAGLARRRR